MPLMPNTLADALASIGEKKTVEDAADAWFEAWFTYAKNMVLLTPAAMGAGPQLKAVFVEALKESMEPSDTADVCIEGYEAAMRAAWLTLSGAPYLNTAYSSVVPAPLPLKLTLGSAVKAATEMKEAKAACMTFALAVDLWTRTFLAIPTTTPPASVPFS